MGKIQHKTKPGFWPIHGISIVVNSTNQIVVAPKNSNHSRPPLALHDRFFNVKKMRF